MDIVEEAKNYLVSYIKGKESDNGKDYPWQQGWEFIVRHSFRVESYTAAIIGSEGGIEKEDEMLIRTAAVLHDIGSLDNRKNHAKTGAQIVKNWCFHKEYIEKQLDVKKLVALIAGHSRKNGKDKDICEAILKDADVIDEIGATSIIMRAHEEDSDKNSYLTDIITRIRTEESDYIDKKMKKLNTKTAKEILKRKADFLEQFCIELEEETASPDELKIYL
ncbi:MAG: HD domain-containing protein [Spirochaetia bacterium]